MFGPNPATLVILPLTTPYPEYPTANWMVCGDRNGPRCKYDTLPLKKDGEPIGHFVFHPHDGGLLWNGYDRFGPVLHGEFLRDKQGVEIAAVKRSHFNSSLFVLASGVEVGAWCGALYLPKQPLQSWLDGVQWYWDDLYR